jgi:hypothetical protein
MPRWVYLAMSGGALALIVTVFVVLALYLWQPWAETPVGSRQGGAEVTPVPQRQVPPAPP